ncbi:PREDICTED: uncharacterized protein LOC104802309 isoform X2 [Tarenaya hassleriana]|uniref:uncharacterized protein LOC104802309 isoform X2 n=1 Tax=Tarenaya hassleriana TaxID=28532 RepID=UPI00053CA52D|nr:PREDICTED: uncharacterized protein LOC104802309 isoform X2 [Tarenaya hassleriana]
MVRKDDLDFFCSFSRKELQSLCKKYDLPDNRSSMGMAESLASYFERNSLSSGAFGVGDQCHSATASGAPASGTRDVKKDYGGSKLDIIREDRSQTTTAGETGFTLGDNTHYQDVHGASTESACATQFTRSLNEKGPIKNSRKDFLRGTDCWLENQTREVNAGEHPRETPSTGCSTSTYSSPSSFEFHVSSEKGINLSVDLNFNPSDWINSMRNEVCVCNSMLPKESRRSDQGTSYLTKSKEQKSLPPLNANSGQGEDGHAVKEASISPLMKDNRQTPSDHRSTGEESLTSSAIIEPCSRKTDGLDKYKKDEGHKLFIAEPSAPGLIFSCAESCSKSCCVVSLDPNCVNSPGKKMASDFGTQENLTGDLPTQKVGNPITETPIRPGGGGSDMSSLEAKPYKLNPSCSLLQCRQELFGIKCGGAGKERSDKWAGAVRVSCLNNVASHIRNFIFAVIEEWMSRNNPYGKEIHAAPFGGHQFHSDHL